MKTKLNIPPYILSIQPYKPGKPIEELEREYGIKDSVKLASNENPLGPSPKAIAAMQAALPRLHRYPDGAGYYLVERLAAKFGIPKESIVLGNGSDEVIGMLTRALLKPGDEAIMTDPSFLMYEILVQSVGARPVFVPLSSLAIDLDAVCEKISPETRMIFLTNPNNPTGTIITRAMFDAFLKRVPPEIVIVIDEAYIEFAREAGCLNGLDFCLDDRPVAVLRTFSKVYGLAGIRIGYGVMPPEMAALLHRVRQPFNANSLAQAGAAAALDDDEFLNQTVRLIHTEIDFLQNALSKRGITCFPTQSNFFLVDVKQDADTFFEAMLTEGVIVRSMVSYGYPQYIRVNAGLRTENERFLAAFEKVMAKTSAS